MSSASGAAVGQLVYSRVEAEYSAARRAGYQTVWRSPSLGAAVVAEIESRVGGFPAPRGERRLQFGRLRSDGFFAARTEWIENPPAIADRHGRAVYLAQVGWAAETELAKLGSDPFVLLAALPAAGIDDLVTAFGQATGSAPELQIEPHGGAGTAGTQTDPSVLLTLVDHLLASEGQPGESPLFLRGPSALVEAVLTEVVSWLPVVLRGGCSFDTQVDRNAPAVATLFVAGGKGPEPPRVPVVDLGASAPPPPAGGSASPYRSWLARELTSAVPSAHADRVEAAYLASLALENRVGPTPSGGLDPEVCREILQHERERLHRRFAERVPWGLGRRRAVGLCAWLVDQLVDCGPEKLVAALLDQHSPLAAPGSERGA